jgi:hypothetical protein
VGAFEELSGIRRYRSGRRFDDFRFQSRQLEFGMTAVGMASIAA